MHLSNGIGQIRVTQKKPTARCNAVCLILELLRPHFSEVFESIRIKILLVYEIYYTLNDDLCRCVIKQVKLTWYA